MSSIIAISWTIVLLIGAPLTGIVSRRALTDRVRAAIGNLYWQRYKPDRDRRSYGSARLLAGRPGYQGTEGGFGAFAFSCLVDWRFVWMCSDLNRSFLFMSEAGSPSFTDCYATSAADPPRVRVLSGAVSSNWSG
jgi:hypothetical protein